MLGISWTLSYQPIKNLLASDALGIPLKPQYFIPRVELNPHLRELSSVNLNIFTFLANSKQIDRAVTRFLLL